VCGGDPPVRQERELNVQPLVDTSAPPDHSRPQTVLFPGPPQLERTHPSICRDGCHSPGRAAVVRDRQTSSVSFSSWVSSTSV
jgi:hypothetical protein